MKSIAVFIDVENIYYSTTNNYVQTPDWTWIVDECKKHGRVSSIQAFGNWIEFKESLPEIQRNGIQPIFVPLSPNGKSSLDCHLTVSAMKLFFQNGAIDMLILVAGDRDYIPLVAELKALGKEVYALAVPDTLSKDLKSIVDHVISYKKEDTGVEDNRDYENGKLTSREGIKSISQSIIEEISNLEKTSTSGWVNLAAIGLSLKKSHPGFTHTHYGHAKLVDMLRAIDGIEIKYDNFEKTIALARTAKEQSIKQHGRQTGKILETNLEDPEERFGFITPDSGGKKIFFHDLYLVNATIEELKKDDRVSYEVYLTERGLNADKVKKIT